MRGSTRRRKNGMKGAVSSARGISVTTPEVSDAADEVPLNVEVSLRLGLSGWPGLLNG